MYWSGLLAQSGEQEQNFCVSLVLLSHCRTLPFTDSQTIFTVHWTRLYFVLGREMKVFMAESEDDFSAHGAGKVAASAELRNAFECKFFGRFLKVPGIPSKEKIPQPSSARKVEKFAPAATFGLRKTCKLKIIQSKKYQNLRNYSIKRSENIFANK